MFKTPLSASRWAVNAPKRSETASETLKDAPDDVQRISRLVDRLRWKAGLLTVSHNEANSTPAASSNPMLRKMFKLDFFEFYALLERVLVYLLAFHRVSVKSDKCEDGASSTNRSIIGSSNVTRDSRTEKELKQERFMASHRYHADVLEAFNKPHNPLHEIIGIGQVKSYLQEAKDLRNRAKDAEDAEALTNAVDSFDHLDTKALENMLSSILEALSRALEATQNFAAQQKAVGNSSGPYKIPEATTAVFDVDGDIMMEDDTPFDTIVDMAD